MIEKLMRCIGVETEGENTEIWRTGKKNNEGEGPRPVLMKIKREIVREQVFENAKKLKDAEEDWRKVYIRRDRTWKQREEERRKEKEFREEMERKNRERRESEGDGEWIVVGRAARRGVKWMEKRERTTKAKENEMTKAKGKGKEIGSVKDGSDEERESGESESSPKRKLRSGSGTGARRKIGRN